jgi:hypothetical protein
MTLRNEQFIYRTFEVRGRIDSDDSATESPYHRFGPISLNQTPLNRPRPEGSPKSMTCGS